MIHIGKDKTKNSKSNTYLLIQIGTESRESVFDALNELMLLF